MVYGSSFGMFKCRTTNYKNQIDVKIRQSKGHGEPIAEPVYERFTLMSPVGYRIAELRKLLRSVVANMVRAERKEIFLVLQRYPQVFTVMGEIVTQYRNLKLEYMFTSDAEENTLFKITATYK